MKSSHKAIFALACALFCAHSLMAQWKPLSADYTGDIHFATGNVGIGSSSVWNRLHIWGPLGNPQTTGIIRVDAPGANAILKVGIETDYAWIQSYNSRPLYINDIGNNIIMNRQGGRLGIGTATPQGKLHVHNEAALGSSLGNSVHLLSVSGNTPNTFAHNTWLKRDNAEGDKGWLNVRLHDAISIDNTFATPGYDTKTWWERDPYENVQSWGNGNQTYMTLRWGALGIGTLNPDAPLTVKGTIHAEEVLIDLSVPVPDYVFETDYNLLPLSEVEAYIKANKHLPEVPSAVEMKASGLNVEEMNMLLLKKVEELTLHLIEMKKENEKMQERLDKLENK